MPKQTVLASALIILFGSAGWGQTAPQNQERRPPDFRVQIWGSVMADFSLRVLGYAQLRNELEKGLAPLEVTDDPAELGERELALAEKVRVARAGASEGELFTPAVAVEFRKVLRIEMDRDTWASLMDDNPGEFEHPINGIYPKRMPLSTVPPNILAALPSLPDGIQYRFLGRHLVLHDTRANVILDRIPYAVHCPDCDT